MVRRLTVPKKVTFRARLIEHYRTRKKPLIKLGTDYYSVDPCFTRDAGYRSLLFNLVQKPDYKELFNERQKVMSEAAFPEILSNLAKSVINILDKNRSVIIITDKDRSGFRVYSGQY